VNFAVEFDGEEGTGTEKINDVAFNGMLAAEACTKLGVP